MLLALTLLLMPANAQDRGARGDDAAFEGAEDEYVAPPKDRLYYTNASFGRINALGLFDTYRLGWRHRLSKSSNMFLQDTYTYIAPEITLTPAYARAGLYGEAQLLAVLRIFAGINGVQYFGSFDQILSFPNADEAVYSDQAIDELGAAGENAPRSGWAFLGGFTVRAAAGPVAIRSTGYLQHYSLALPEGDVAFYDQFWDRLAPNNGFMWLQDTDVIVLAGKARIGARHSFTDNMDGSGGDGGLAHHRVGPLLAFQFKDEKPGAKFNQPTAFLLAQWWLQHPYRAGTEQPQGMPLIAFGFAFNGDYAMSKN